MIDADLVIAQLRGALKRRNDDLDAALSLMTQARAERDKARAERDQALVRAAEYERRLRVMGLL